MRFKILLAFLPLVLLSACSTVNSLSSTAGTVENSTIQFATATYITKAGSDPASQLARAQKVKAVAVEIQGYDTGTVSIAQLEAKVMADIGKLSPANQILANELMQIIVAQLGVQVQSGLLNASIVAQINVVMNDVIAACKLFGA
jgi:hypothetical protein